MLHTEPGIVTNSFVGTEEYIAPEVIKGFGHTSAVDWWTFGILLFELLFGTTPFRGRTRDDTFGHILGGEIKFPDRTAYAPISRQCKDLIQHLLHPDPTKRLGATHGACEVKKHPWFKGIKWELIRNEEPPIVPQISGPYDTRYFNTIPDDGLIDRLEAECAAPQKKLHSRSHHGGAAKEEGKDKKGEESKAGEEGKDKKEKPAEEKEKKTEGKAESKQSPKSKPEEASSESSEASTTGKESKKPPKDDPFTGFDSEKTNAPFAQTPTVHVPDAKEIAK